MKIKSAEFVTSSKRYTDCPPGRLPEIAFIGRSNVGKSSLINMLLNKKKLAKTSSTPGKTQLINHFVVNEAWYLVDLPGYGWAKVGKSQKKQWARMIRDYLEKRSNLLVTFILVDVRHPAQQIDLEFINWMGRKQLPFVLAFTKVDKLSAQKINSNIEAFGNEMLKTWESLPPVFTTSATNKTGREDILNYMNEVLSDIS